jgi:hypothetical protein
MRVLSRLEIRKINTMPIYEFGSRESVGYIPISEEVHFEDEWRCSYCGRLWVAGLSGCPYCGGEY